MIVSPVVSPVVSRVKQGALVMALLVTAGAIRVTHAEPRPPQAVTVEVTARRFAFVPDRIEVVEGDLITLAVKSADGAHGLEIKKLKVKQEIPRGGAVVTLVFTAPTPGYYAIACSEYCGRGHDGMKATLVVKPRAE